MPPRVLLIDDDEAARTLLASELDRAGFEVSEASDGLTGLAAFEALAPDVIVTDKNMPGKDGLELLADIRERSSTPVIMLTAFGSVPSAVHAMKSGAVDYLSSDEIELSEVVELVRSAAQTVYPAVSADAFMHTFPGSSRLAGHLRQRLAVFAPLPSPVLVQGAAGTEKRRLIQAIHDQGSSARGSLVELDGASFHVQSIPKGTTAVHLTGVGGLSREAQAYWVAQEQASGPRLFVSTETASEIDSLSLDLAARLRLFVLDIPLLEDHLEDFIAVATVALDEIGRDLKRSEIELEARARQRLLARRWHGNEQELRDVLRRATILSPGRLVGADAIDQALDEVVASVARIRKLERSRERDLLVAALKEAGGVISHASRLLNMNRSAVYRLMDKHGLDRERRA